MPTIYLSPSTQQANPYITGGTEEYYMNRLADAMVPYLRSSGIQYTRNTPDMTAASSIRASNAGNYDVHLALHSNAAPDALSGQIRGTDVYFLSRQHQRQTIGPSLLVHNLKQVYPNPAKVRAVPTTSLGEVSRTRAPGVLIEYAYHDNVEDANWIKNNLDSIARATVRALTEYFGIPFVEPQPAQEARATFPADISTSAASRPPIPRFWPAPTTATPSPSWASGRDGMWSITAVQWDMPPLNILNRLVEFKIVSTKLQMKWERLQWNVCQAPVKWNGISRK